MRWGERKPGPLGSGWCRVASMQQVRSPRTVGLEKLAESGPHAGTGQGGGRGRRSGGAPSDPAGGGWEEASRPAAGPAHGSEAGSYLRRADCNKTWEGPGAQGAGRPDE